MSTVYSPKGQSGPSNGCIGGSELAHTALVPTFTESSFERTHTCDTIKESPPATNGSNEDSSIGEKIRNDDLLGIRQRLEGRGISQRAVEIIISYWRDSTKAQYQVYIDKWLRCTQKIHCDSIISPPLNIFLEFLVSLYESGLSYSSINTARSALSQFLISTNNDVPYGQITLVTRFMTGVFQSPPAFPRYN